jgi:type IV pilus assembly protein PilC
VRLGDRRWEERHIVWGNDGNGSSEEKITAGETITKPIQEVGIFPPLVVHLISVGEESGRLGEMLSKIADFYEDEVDTAVSTLASTIEPLMIVIIGVFVGGMLIAMYLPIFGLAGTIK